MTSEELHPYMKLTSGWAVAPLAELTTKIGSGATPRGGKNSYVDEGVHLIRSQNVHDLRFSSDGLAHITDDAADKLAGVEVQAGDVLLNITGASIARCCRAPDWVLPARVNQHVAIVRPSDSLDARFLMYALVHPGMRAYVLSHNAGASREAITKRHIEGLLVPVPPIEEQRAIAEVLGALDDRIEWCSGMKEALHDLGSATLDEWLGEHGLSSSRPLRDEQQLPLGDVVAVLESGTRPRGGVNGINEGVPSVGAESITRIGDFDYSKTKYVPKEFFDAMRRGHVEEFDVLVYKDGGQPGTFIPHASMAGEGHPFPRFAVNDHVYRVRVTPPYGQAFLYFWLSTSQSTEEMARRGTGAAQPGLNQSNLKQVPVPRIDAGALEEVDRRLMSVARPILHYGKEQRLLAELRDALLPKLLSGELRLENPSWLLGEVA